MYSVVLMVAATSGGDMASFGKDKGGCTGCTGYVAGCSGSSCHGGGFLGLRDKLGNSCNGGGFLGHKDKGSCHGSGCHGTYAAGCTGSSVVVAAPAAPVAAAPAGCTGCTGYTYSGSCHGSSCHGGGFLGLRDGGGLFKKKGCNGGCHGW